MKKGIVYLVGAGPGDPKLITLRGLEALQKSDAVVYDRLANPRLLLEAKQGAELIYVGKLPDRHTMPQDEINQILVDLASQGKCVTRLKGGDPCVFGRGGEEASKLAEHGIAFEIVPGVTSAIAVPAYAGIPVTHRDFNSSFTIVTGHEKPDKLDSMIDWNRMASSGDTLIFLMGVARIDYISKQLIRHGLLPTTPVALVRWGTYMEQATLMGTLEDIAEKVKAADFKPPAVIVIGEVVRLREKLAWFEHKPLFGKRVLVTRARAQNSELVKRIEELGGEAVEFPVIRMQMPKETAALANLDQALRKLSDYTWVIFTSVNGVTYFFQRLRQLNLDIRQMQQARIVAVGPQTQEALEEKGLVTESLPSEYQAEGVLDLLKPLVQSGEQAMVVRGNLARTLIPDQLRQWGLLVTEATVYENVPTDDGVDEVVKLLKKRAIHVVTFTSSSTVKNLFHVLKKHGVAEPETLLKEVQVVCIGPATARTAEAYGFSVHAIAKKATMYDMVHALETL